MNGDRTRPPDGVEGLPRWRTVLFAPVLHYRLEFADAVRTLIERWRPEAIAVELPPTLEPQVRRAVARLPQLSVVVYQNAAAEWVYLPVEPCDALIEAVRSGLERGIPVTFADLDIDEFPLHDEPFPDSYTVFRLGLPAWWRAYRTAVPAPVGDATDARRETSMAYALQQLAEAHERVLMVCGVAHVAGVMAKLDQPLAQPLARVRRDHVQVFHVHPDSAREIMATMPFEASVYETRRRALPELQTEREPKEYLHPSGLRLIASGRQTVAGRMSVRARLRAELARECGSDPNDAYSPLDRRRLQLAFARAARAAYENHTGERLAPSLLATWLRYCRNYALLTGRLLPDLYQLIVGARGVADDNLAWEVWDLGSEWPWQKEHAELPTVRLSPEEIWLGSRRFSIRPRHHRPKRRLHPVSLRERHEESRPGEWRTAFHGAFGICSYPPEDVLIEGFGEHLKARAKHLLAEDDARVEPFTTSLLDGIDVRETLRCWHEHTLYVRELRRIRGEVGSVIVIFDPDELDRRYPWRTTWHGEHDQESDMAFYASDPLRQIVGPGISRCEYGGFLLSYPPGRLYDVWHDRDYTAFRAKSEVLLAAGLDYSEHKHVVYVAAKPPRSLFQTIAGRLGRSIIYLPIGGLSPVTIKKLRVFHVLAGRDKRAIAPEYIW